VEGHERAQWRPGGSKWSPGGSIDCWSQIPITLKSSWIRIRIKRKSWIRIRIQVKSLIRISHSSYAYPQPCFFEGLQKLNQNFRYVCHKLLTKITANAFLKFHVFLFLIKIGKNVYEKVLVLPEVLQVVWCGAGRPLAHHKEDGGAQVQEAVPAPAPHSTQGPQREPQAHQPWPNTK
jgi:hypothetical protein